jgi:DNA-binding MarR family transcriptional regulator
VIQPEAQHDDHATRVWVALQAFVRAQDRREELRETLCLGRGTGRVTALMKLTEGPLTLRDIAELIGVDAPYATLIVDHLEARGLVERTLHPGDRRRKLVTLTLAGREAAALASHIMDQPPAGFTQLTDDELAVLEKILNRLGSVLDPGEIAAAADAVDAVLANPGPH